MQRSGNENDKEQSGLVEAAKPLFNTVFNYDAPKE